MSEPWKETVNHILPAALIVVGLAGDPWATMTLPHTPVSVTESSSSTSLAPTTSPISDLPSIQPLSGAGLCDVIGWLC